MKKLGVISLIAFGFVLGKFVVYDAVFNAAKKTGVEVVSSAQDAGVSALDSARDLIRKQN